MDEKNEQFVKRLSAVRVHLENLLKKLRRRKLCHEQDVESGKQWEEEMHRAEVLKSGFSRLKRGMREIEVVDWEKPEEKLLISLDPILEPDVQLAGFFKRARKLKRRYLAAQALLQKAEKEIAALEEARICLESISDIVQLQAFEKQVGYRDSVLPVTKKKEGKRHPFREFTTLSGRTIFVGKKDQDNDLLTFHFAHGLDLWFHAANTPGSHVVLRIPKAEAIDDDAIQDALQLALYFSKARGRGRDEVVMTECKHLHKPRGAPPGQVHLSRHKTVMVREDEKRLKRLLQKLL